MSKNFISVLYRIGGNGEKAFIINILLVNFVIFFYKTRHI